MDCIEQMNNLVASIDVKEYEGQPVVSSREVANNFEKKHKHVLESIENIKAENSAVTKMFIESSYKAGTGKNYKEYLLTRDGFSLLVMGFTGAKALEWKLKYIEAFNKMEQYIKEQKPKVPTTYKEALEHLLIQVEENERLQLENEQQTKVIEKQSDVINELKPHAEYAKRVLEDNESLLNPTQIAKDFGMSGQALNALLHDLGVQYKQNGQWLLYAKYQGKGYARSVQPDKPYTKSTTKWTQAGKKFIHDILRKNGYKTLLESKQEQQRFDFN